MGYLKQLETDELHLPSDPTQWVRMKKKATYGDSRAAQTALLKVSGSNNGAPALMATDIEVGAYIGTLTVRLITEWSLTDANEQPLAITLPNLDLLDDEDGEFLAAEAQKRKGARPQEAEVPFSKPSIVQSSGTTSKTRK